MRATRPHDLDNPDTSTNEGLFAMAARVEGLTARQLELLQFLALFSDQRGVIRASSRELALELGVSRPSVRQLLRRLAERGLVTIVHDHTTVRCPSERDKRLQGWRGGFSGDSVAVFQSNVVVVHPGGPLSEVELTMRSSTFLASFARRWYRRLFEICAWDPEQESAGVDP